MDRPIEKRLTWKQIHAWKWSPLSAKFSWTNATTGRHCFRCDRLGRCESEVRKAYAKAGRADLILDGKLTLRRGRILYLVDPQPIIVCRKCGRETWVTDFLGYCDSCSAYKKVVRE